ncbi:hypothetical protein PG989_006424 [Apiospora arundinis]
MRFFSILTLASAVVAVPTAGRDGVEKRGAVANLKKHKNPSRTSGSLGSSLLYSNPDHLVQALCAIVCAADCAVSPLTCLACAALCASVADDEGVIDIGQAEVMVAHLKENAVKANVAIKEQ